MPWVSIFRDAEGHRRVYTMVVPGTVERALEHAEMVLEEANSRNVDLYALIETLDYRSKIFDLRTIRCRIYLELGID